MSTRRVMVPGASLAWTVDSTRWPVSALFTAMSAVSASRISPTMITSGSWRRIERSARERHADLLVRVHLIDALDVVLDRVFHRDQVALRRLDLVEGRIQRGGLAAPGRPRDQQHAVGLADRALERGESRPFEAEIQDLAREGLLVEEPQHDLFAERGGQRR